MSATVAIVGRPNVGKSTLFNRLVGRRQAIVHDMPGVTRDRVSGSAELDDDRVVTLIDTGGLVPGDDPIGLNAQVHLAVEESDLLLLVVDGREGLVSADQTVWEELRRHDKPALLVVNKGDTKAAVSGFDEFYSLGLEEQILVSAEHGLGIGELREAILERVPATSGSAIDMPALAIVGRPNVGKSSLLNRLVGESRSLVSERAGTTRDPVDTVLEREDQRSWLLVDTAGIRRRSQVESTAEELAVMMARRQVERCHVAVLVVDAAQGVTAGDLAIAGLVWEQGKAAVVAVNKWDLLDEESRRVLDDSWPRIDEVLYRAPRVNLSALTERGVQRLLPAVDEAYDRFHTEVATSELNRILEQAVARHHAPTRKGRAWKFLYATQVSTAPPTFMMFVNRVLPRQDPYRRYLENRLREALALPGVPLRLVMRERRGRGKGSGARKRDAADGR